MIDPRVLQALSKQPFCLVGAAALAVHGVARFSVDLDLLTLDSSVLDAGAWTLPVDIRRGDADDPFEGVVRIALTPPCDVLVGRGKAMRFAVQTAVHNDRFKCAVATIEALVILKLEAGGPIDIQDVHALIASARLLDGADLGARVPLDKLSPGALRLWQTIHA